MSPDAGRPGAGTPGRSSGGDFAGAGGGSVVPEDTSGPRHLERIDRYLKTASISTLGALLNEAGVVVEDPRFFFCTKCQRTPAQQIDKAPAAYATSTTTWSCTACGKPGTRWTLIGAVRNRPIARARLLDLLGQGGRHG